MRLDFSNTVSVQVSSFFTYSYLDSSARDTSDGGWCHLPDTIHNMTARNTRSLAVAISTSFNVIAFGTALRAMNAT